MNTSVGTDPTLALETRHGTGFYKVPSLRGLWYRERFRPRGASGDAGGVVRPRPPRGQLRPQGIPTGPGPIEGHEKGLDLTPEEKQDLIAFLKTL
jgi:hypothetical protein